MDGIGETIGMANDRIPIEKREREREKRMQCDGY